MENNPINSAGVSAYKTFVFFGLRQELLQPSLQPILQQLLHPNGKPKRWGEVFGL
jgi:hypothetical protein